MKLKKTTIYNDFLSFLTILLLVLLLVVVQRKTNKKSIVIRTDTWKAIKTVSSRLNDFVFVQNLTYLFILNRVQKFLNFWKLHHQHHPHSGKLRLSFRQSSTRRAPPHPINYHEFRSLAHLAHARNLTINYYLIRSEEVGRFSRMFLIYSAHRPVSVQKRVPNPITFRGLGRRR